MILTYKQYTNKKIDYFYLYGILTTLVETGKRDQTLLKYGIPIPANPMGYSLGSNIVILLNELTNEYFARETSVLDVIKKAIDKNNPEKYLSNMEKDIVEDDLNTDGIKTREELEKNGGINYFDSWHKDNKSAIMYNYALKLLK